MPASMPSAVRLQGARWRFVVCFGVDARVQFKPYGSREDRRVLVQHPDSLTR